MTEDEAESGLKNETYQETATLVLAIANTTFKKSGVSALWFHGEY